MDGKPSIFESSGCVFESRRGRLMNVSQPPDLNLIRMLSERLERISADSVWAHRASGVRGTLLDILDEIENQDAITNDAIDRVINNGMEILKAAAKEKTGLRRIR